MKALVYTAPFEMQYRDQDEPGQHAGDVIVDVQAAGICGSDMHAFHGHDPRRNPPLVLGHEVAGICQTGAHASQAVAINPLISCGQCEYCGQGRFNLCPERTMIGMTRPGAFAEHVAIPERNLFVLPPHMNPVHAALAEPTATAVHALHLAARTAVRPLSEARTAVIGGGAIGLISALLLRAYGAPDPLISEPNPLRQTTAARAGMDNLHDPGKNALSEDHFDLVVDAVGSAVTRRVAISAVRPGGVVLSIGLQESGGELDARKLTLAEISLLGCYTYTPSDFGAALSVLANGALGELEWVETHPLSEGARMFGELDKGRVAAAKVVLIP